MDDPNRPADEADSQSSNDLVEARDVTDTSQPDGASGGTPSSALGSAGPLPSDAVPTYLLPAILATLCCCFPAGLVALIYAVQIPSRLQAGDLAAAEKASESARRWTILALILGILVIAALLSVQLLSAF